MVADTVELRDDSLWEKKRFSAERICLICTIVELYVSAEQSYGVTVSHTIVVET